MAHVGLLEDNTRIAKLCATMLQYSGHRVSVYNHPQVCLSALLPELDEENLPTPNASLAVPPALNPRTLRPALALPALVDVLIMDLHLPDIPGLDVLRLLRSHARTQSLPLIFCTAAAATEVATALTLAPQARCIEKPFTFQELNAAITAVLGL